MRSSNTSANVMCFLAGLSLGAAAGLLLAPVPGADTRKFLTSRAGSARGYFDRGRELYEQGRGLADEAAELYEEGRRLVEDI